MVVGWGVEVGVKSLPLGSLSEMKEVAVYRLPVIRDTLMVMGIGVGWDLQLIMSLKRSMSERVSCLRMEARAGPCRREEKEGW